jgi:hypothetical protein
MQLSARNATALEPIDAYPYVVLTYCRLVCNLDEGLIECCKGARSCRHVQWVSFGQPKVCR